MVVVMVVVREGRSVPVYGRGGVVELRTGGSASGSKTEEGGSVRKRNICNILFTFGIHIYLHFTFLNMTHFNMENITIKNNIYKFIL